jgi:hypothetical protein
VILDTKGNIFGGFTPVKWESLTSKPWYKPDDSLKSFLFTLKNPHNIPARRFAMKYEMKDRVVWRNSTYRPCFTGGIIVKDNCNTNTQNWTQCGNYETNDTGLDECIVFKGSEYFQVKQIEVIEITD